MPVAAVERYTSVRGLGDGVVAARIGMHSGFEMAATVTEVLARRQHHPGRQADGRVPSGGW
ncbi:hypothetical protein [Falsiroseomonas sp.]|uniref:hypothetical protein n=1 Tax=Falsiroseomonas sp. TaxID=2870721 RepID=UPI003567A37F